MGARQSAFYVDEMRKGGQHSTNHTNDGVNNIYTIKVLCHGYT